MKCRENLYIYYDELQDIIKISHCCFDRIRNIIGELSPQEFYKLSEKEFYDYIHQIIFTKPWTCCDGISCEEHWRQENFEITQIAVSISRQCNLSCPMCYVRQGGHKDSSKRKQLYLDMIEKLKNLKFNSLKLTDWGEPLIYIDEVLNILKNYKYCKNLDIVTNGTLLTKNIIDKILSIMTTTTIIVDCDSLIKTNYEKIRVGANFHKFFKNLMNIIELSKNSNYKDKFFLGLGVVITNENRNELMQLTKFFKKNNINYFIQDSWHPSIEFSY